MVFQYVLHHQDQHQHLMLLSASAEFMSDLLTKVVTSKVGCNVGGVTINILAYVDDLVLLAPSCRGLQYLLEIVVQQSMAIDMSLNARKSVCMVFNPRDQSKVILPSFPPFRIGTEMLEFIPSFNCLGHIITCNNYDDMRH